MQLRTVLEVRRESGIESESAQLRRKIELGVWVAALHQDLRGAVLDHDRIDVIALAVEERDRDQDVCAESDPRRESVPDGPPQLRDREDRQGPDDDAGPEVIRCDPGDRGNDRVALADPGDAGDPEQAQAGPAQTRT